MIEFDDEMLLQYLDLMKVRGWLRLIAATTRIPENELLQVAEKNGPITDEVRAAAHNFLLSDAIRILMHRQK